jgi:hypothetical protein
MLTLLRIANVVLLLALFGCLAGAMAGLIVVAPFVGGAWLLNLMALVGYEEDARPGWIERGHAPAPGHSPEAVRAVPEFTRAEFARKVDEPVPIASRGEPLSDMRAA